MPGEKHYFKKTIRIALIKAGNRYSALVCFIGTGIWSLNFEDRDISYEHYLGPDWKCNHQPSTRISNHMGFTDIALHMYKTGIPSFIAKEDTKKLPIICSMAIAASTLFVDRGDKKNRRDLI